MEKIYKILYILFISFYLISCKHECEYELKYNSEFHYKKCSCGSVIEEAKHEYSNEIIKEPTCTEEGINKNKCKICNYEFNENIDKIDHNYELKYNDEMHYKKCSCGSIIEEENHTYEWIIDINSTDLEDGYMHEQCINCNSKKNENTIIEKKCTLEQVKDEELIKGLIDNAFYNNYNILGNIPYRLLWDGNLSLDSQNVERSVFTYLIEYQQKDEGYYVVYLDKSLIKEYRRKEISNDELYQHTEIEYFTYYSQEKIIDGKYLKLFNKSERDLSLLKVFKVKDLDEIKMNIDNYQLVYCAESKKSLIKENLSTGEIINNEMTIFKRFFIKNDKEEIIDINNNYRINNMIEDFEYVGEQIELHRINYNDNKYDYIIKNQSYKDTTGYASAKLIEMDSVKYIILPRYYGNEKIDLLMEEDKLDYYNDVFGKYKKEFLSTYYKDYTDIIDGYFTGLYEYDKVKEIIKEK